MELFRLFGSIVLKDEATDKINDIEKKSSTASTGIQGAFKKIGTALVTAFAVDKIIDFGKNIVETTAKIQALDSQFAQTFKGDQVKAMDLISKQAKEQGINVDRLKGTWASFYGTFRGNGADANQSLDLTNKYMKLAADGAAYYDLSLEDVSGRLKSLVMGNFEAGDAIGVNINATKMDIKAKEKYKKAWKDLSDTEKEFLLIDTVGTIYKNNGAMGQGSREANNWSNVTENLKATWERFLSIIGSPILANVTKLVQGLTGIVEQLSAKVQSFDVSKFVSQLSDSGGVAGALGNTFNLLKDIFLTVKDRFIEIVTGIVATAKEWYENNQDTITKIVETFNSCMGLIRDIVNNAVDIIMAIWNTFGKYVFDIVASYLGFVLTKVQAVLKMVSGVFKIVASLIKGDWKGAWDGVKTLLSGALTYIYNLIVEKLIGAVIGKINSFGSSIKNIFTNIKTNASSIWNSIFSSISSVVGNIASKVGINFSGLKSTVSSIWNGIKSAIITPITSATSSVATQIARIKGFFSGLALRLPQIKLPHFTLNGGFSLNPPRVPNIGLEWYANGGILTQPTIFGMNGNKAMVGGEAGAEAVLPIEKLSGILANTLSDLGYGQQPIVININGREVFNAMSPYMAMAAKGKR